MADMDQLAGTAKAQNGWFDRGNVERAFQGIHHMLDEGKLKKWVGEYELNPEVPKIVGIIMAGNIPMVGFHDLMSVLISGHVTAVKLSSQDTFLMTKIIEWIVEIEPRFRRNIEIREKLETIDGVICTGSDNTARYFEYYFGKHPHIIRKNRTSIAILDGSETEDELKAFGEDIFAYYGLGCRNISKIYAPSDYDITKIFPPLESYTDLIHHNKYKNNYDYNKAIYLVNKEKHLDNGFLLLRSSEELVSPTSVLYHESYDDKKELEDQLSNQKEKIQCIIGHDHIPFGKGQSPDPWDYADGVDTLKFLSELK